MDPEDRQIKGTFGKFILQLQNSEKYFSNFPKVEGTFGKFILQFQNSEKYFSNFPKVDVIINEAFGKPASERRCSSKETYNADLYFHFRLFFLEFESV